MISKVLFTGCGDGEIRIWNIPEQFKDDKFPITGGRNSCVGVWSDGEKAPYLSLDYHYFLPLLLAVKSGKPVQVWDCNEVVRLSQNYDFSDPEKCKIDFNKLD
jgi:WD40 repeat protein